MQTEGAPSSPTSSRDGFAKELECVICQCVMVDPRVLSCQHAFCLRCLFGVVKRDRGAGLTVPCPFRCHEITKLSGDIRSLKRNPMIGNLCVRFRKLNFEKKAEMCDWCAEAGEGRAPGFLTFCDRCGATICATCDEKTSCDHRFLCGPLRGDAWTPPVSVRQNFLSPWAGRRVAEDLLPDIVRNNSRLAFERVRFDRETTPFPSIMYLRAVSYEVQVNGPEHTGLFHVTLLPDDGCPGIDLTLFAQRGRVVHSCISDLEPSPELVLLRDCTDFATTLKSFGESVVKLTNSLKRVLRPELNDAAVRSASDPSLRHVTAVALALDACVAVAALQFAPLLRQTIVVAHLLGLDRVSALQTAWEATDDFLQRAAFANCLAGEIKVGMSLGNFAYEALNDALKSIGAAESASTTLSSLLLEERPAAKTDESESSTGEEPQYEREVDGVAFLAEKVSQLLEHTIAKARAFVALSDAAFDKALRGEVVDAEHREQFSLLRARLKELRAHVRLVSFSWTAATGLFCQLGRRFPMEAAKPLSIADPLSEEQQDVVDGVQRLIESLLPQIAAFREQHAQLIGGQRSAARHQRDVAAQSLQVQLTQLMLQAVDLFGKDEIMKAQSFAAMFTRVKHVEAELKRVVTKHTDQQLVSDAVVSCDVRQVSDVCDLIGAMTPSKGSDRLAQELRRNTLTHCTAWLPIVGRGQSADRAAENPVVRDASGQSVNLSLGRRSADAVATVTRSTPLDGESHRVAGTLPADDDAARSLAQKLAITEYHNLIGHSRGAVRTALTVSHPIRYVLVPVAYGYASVLGVAPRGLLKPEDQQRVDGTGHGTMRYLVDEDAVSYWEPPPRTQAMQVLHDVNARVRRSRTFAVVAFTFNAAKGALVLTNRIFAPPI